MNSTEQPAVAGPVERPVRPLLERLREATQGEELFGFDGLRDEPDALLTEAAGALEDMGAMMRRLVWLGRKHCPALVAWGQAAELLHKHGLDGRSLRSTDAA